MCECVCVCVCVCVAQEVGRSPCPSKCMELSKSATMGSLSESGAVLVEACSLLVLAVDNKVSSAQNSVPRH